MKIAGRKNDGAWFRTNQAIINIKTDPERTNLAAKIAALPTMAAAHNALLALMTEVGVTGIPHAPNPAQWAQSFVTQGIPRQIWLGSLSWSTYTKNTGTHGIFGTSKDTGYTKNYDGEIRRFAVDLRRCLRDWMMARRQIRDVFNSGTAAEGNPGGLPDANTNQ